MEVMDINDLNAGMILAKPVYNTHGVLLLDAGAQISEKNIRIFKSWGIGQVQVKGGFCGESHPYKDANAVARETIEMALQEKFSDVIDDPVMVEIMKAACNQLTKRRQQIEE